MLNKFMINHSTCLSAYINLNYAGADIFDDEEDSPSLEYFIYLKLIELKADHTKKNHDGASFPLNEKNLSFLYDVLSTAEIKTIIENEIQEEYGYDISVKSVDTSLMNIKSIGGNIQNMEIMIVLKNPIFDIKDHQEIKKYLQDLIPLENKPIRFSSPKPRYSSELFLLSNQRIQIKIKGHINYALSTEEINQLISIPVKSRFKIKTGTTETEVKGFININKKELENGSD
jgi:hypothetical protein